MVQIGQDQIGATGPTEQKPAPVIADPVLTASGPALAPAHILVPESKVREVEAYNQSKVMRHVRQTCGPRMRRSLMSDALEKLMLLLNHTQRGYSALPC